MAADYSVNVTLDAECIRSTLEKLVEERCEELIDFDQTHRELIARRWWAES